MNILFYTTNEVAPQYGGVERVTANIANALTTFYNVNCYSAYKYNIDKSFIKQQFVNTIKINSYHNLNNLIQFIEQLEYLQPIITQYFIDNKSEIWLLFLIAHSKR